MKQSESDRKRLIDELVATGQFTTRDKSALLLMSIDALTVIHAKSAGIEEVTNSYEDFVHCHRPKAMRRKPRSAVPSLAMHGIADDEARSMVPPSTRRGR